MTRRLLPTVVLIILAGIVSACGPGSAPGPRARGVNPAPKQVPSQVPASMPRIPDTSAISSPASVSTTQPAASQRRIQLIEEPKAGGLRRFHQRLLSLEKLEIKRVRVLHWGDSHVASDVMTGTLRAEMQAHFGDAGPGFALLGRPWRSYRHEAARYGVAGRWRAERIHGRYSRRRPRPRDDHFGAAGVSVHTAMGRVARTWLQPRRGPIAHADLFYLAQPRGGSVEVLVDGHLARRLGTASAKPHVKTASFALGPTARRVELRSTGDGEVRLYGADLRRANPGILYDTMGINGARADMQLAWGEKAFAEMLRALGPDLLVFAYGSNELDATHLRAPRLTADLRRVIGRARRLLPAADCLVVGAPDQARRVDPRKRRRPGPITERQETQWQILDRLSAIVGAQRHAARAEGCAFWDQRAAMGGAGSIYSWRDAEPPLARADHVHFYVRGYRRLGRALYGALMASYRAFRLRRVLAQTRPSTARAAL